MKVTFAYRHAMVNDENKSAEVFSVFPRFLDTPGLVWHLHSLNTETYCKMQHKVPTQVVLLFFFFFFFKLQIEQDFRVMFGEQTANKFMERWPTTFKAGVIKESHGLVPSTDLLDLMRNAETSTEVEKGKSLMWRSMLLNILRMVENYGIMLT